MGLETVTYISDFNPLWPLGSDPKSNGDNHLQIIKFGVQNTFINITGQVTATHVEINYLSGVTSNVQVQLTNKANTASPTFTGTVVLPASTSIGTVTAAEVLTLSGVTSAIQTQLNAKGAIAGQTWTGTHDYTAGTINVPTATAGDATNKAASTAFVASAAFSAVLPGQAGNAGKVVKTNGSAASWEWIDLPINTMSASGTALMGYNNMVTTAGIAVTMPTSTTALEPIEITNASDAITATVNFGTVKVQGRTTPGVMTLNDKGARFRLRWSGNSTQGWI